MPAEREATVQGGGNSKSFATEQFDGTQASMDAVPAEWQEGNVILDLYEVKQVHHGGGMGLVYRVHHRDWDMEMAVKSPRAEYCHTQAHKENFVRECLTWVGLGLHPHIVCCYYVRVLGGIPRVFAEYVEGGSLKDWIDSKKLYEGGPEKALERMLDIAIQFAWGLDYAHSKEFIHQDVKPANVMMTPDGTAKVTDFGLAKARAVAGETMQANSGRSILVSSGGMTPAYCSPEQARSCLAAHEPKRGPWARLLAGRFAKVQHRDTCCISRKTDIWSWAVSVLEIFTGDVFWQAGQLAPAALDSYLEMGPADESFPPMPDPLVVLLRHCFQIESEDRPADMKTIVARLQEMYAHVIGRHHERPAPKPIEALADTLNNQAISLRDLGQEQEAEQLFNSAIEADPHHPEATYNRGLLRWRSGRSTDEQLIRQLEEVRTSHDSDWRDEYLLALVHIERGDAESAVNLLEQASNMNPEGRGIFRALALARRGIGQWGGCVRTLGAQTSPMHELAVMRNGRGGLSYGSDKSISLWDLVTGQRLRVLEGHREQVRAVAIDSKGKRALSAGSWHVPGSPCELMVWDLVSGKCMRELGEHLDAVRCVAISSDGLRGVSGGNDTTLRVWDLDTGRCLRVLEGHTGPIWSIALSEGDRWLISGSDDETLRLWDFRTGRCLQTLEGLSGPIGRVTISRDGSLALSAGRKLQLWDLSTGRCVRAFEGHSQPISAVAFSEDACRAVSAACSESSSAMGSSIRLWDVATGRCLRTFEDDTQEAWSIVFRPDGVSGFSADGSSGHSGIRQTENKHRICLWRFQTGLPHDYVEASVRTAGDLGTESHQYAMALREATRALQAGQIAEALAAARSARSIRGYERKSGALELWASLGLRSRRTGFRGGWLVRRLEANASPLLVAHSPNGGWWVLENDEGIARFMDVRVAQVVHTLQGHTGAFNHLVVTTDGRWAFSAIQRASLGLWDVAAGQCLRTVVAPFCGIGALAISRDGHLGLCGQNNPSDPRPARIAVLDLSTGKLLRELWPDRDWRANSPVHSAVHSLAISPDGLSALSGSGDGTLRLWDLKSGECLRTLTAHGGGIQCVAFSPDGRVGLSGGFDNTLRSWDVNTGEPLLSFDNLTACPFTIAMSSDGRYTAAATLENTVRLWDIATGRCLRVFDGYRGHATSLAISPDGRWLLSAGVLDKSIWLWELDWEYEFPGWTDWDEGARRYLEMFLTLHSPYGPDSISRVGTPVWTDEDFAKLLTELRYRGYGWLRPEGVRRKLEEMAADWQGPPSPPGQK